MQTKIKYLAFLGIAGSILTMGFTPAMAEKTVNPDVQAILKNTPNLNKDALEQALSFYHKAVSTNTITNKNILTIVDFDLPSYEKRLWVIDLTTDKPIMNLYTTHGKNSGDGPYAKRFSNVPDSKESSLGAFKTLYTYDGKHGYSEKLQGLQKNINNNVFDRSIVVHQANYASEAYIAWKGYAGTSWGCFALGPKVYKKFIDTTKGGSLLYAYSSTEHSAA